MTSPVTLFLPPPPRSNVFPVPAVASFDRARCRLRSETKTVDRNSLIGTWKSSFDPFDLESFLSSTAIYDTYFQRVPRAYMCAEWHHSLTFCSHPVYTSSHNLTQRRHSDSEPDNPVAPEDPEPTSPLSELLRADAKHGQH